MPVAELDDATSNGVRTGDIVPGAVTVTRTSEADYKSRQLIVWIDGMRLATLLWGASFPTGGPPGPHRLRVSNTLFWKTIDFTVAPGEQVYFEAINRMGPGSVFVA